MSNAPCCSWKPAPWGLLRYLIFAAACLLLFLPLPPWLDGGWRSTLLDLGHVPLFALLTVTLARVLGCRWYHAVGIGVLLAAGVELAQSVTGRSASWTDLGYGTAGVLSAGVLLRAAEWRARSMSRSRLLGHAMVALTLTALPVLHAAPGLLDAAEGVASFPVLADFRSESQLRRWICRQARLSRAKQGDSIVGRLEFLPGAEDYPGAQLEHVLRDFRGYDRLCWALTVENEAVTLAFSLRSGPDRSGRTRHYQFQRRLEPGEHVVEMDLLTAAAHGEEGQLDLANLWYSQLFVVRPTEPRAVQVRRVWLE